MVQQDECTLPKWARPFRKVIHDVSAGENMKTAFIMTVCVLMLGCHICLEHPRNIEMGSTSFTTSPVKFSAEFECPQNPNSLLFVIRGMKAEFSTFCYPPEWNIGGAFSLTNLSEHTHAEMVFSRTNVVLGSWNTPDTTAILSFPKHIHDILSRGDKCRIDLTLTEVPEFTNRIDVMFHYIGSIRDKE